MVRFGKYRKDNSMNRKNMIAAVFAMVFGISAVSEQVPVGGMTSSATLVVAEPTSTASVVAPGVGESASGVETGRGVGMTSATSPGVRVRISPILMFAQQDPRSYHIAEIVVANRLAGTTTSLTGYDYAYGQINAANIVAGTNNSWTVIRQLVDMISIDGEETIDLGGIQIRSFSSPSTVLNSSYEVGLHGYGPAAVGVRKNGTLIVSGAPNQKAARVIFITQMALFIGDITDVKHWLLNQGDFSITYEAWYRASTYVGKAVVRLFGISNWPKLDIVRHRHNENGVWVSSGKLRIASGETHQAFILQSASAVNGPYQAELETPTYFGHDYEMGLGQIDTGQTGQNRFYRLMPVW